MKSKDRGTATGWRRLRGQDNEMFLISSVARVSLAHMC